ncbi:iron-containing alcohol dehydrogenase [Acetonema longum]|uniref:Alcohol dehydrogenase n=1 Tax=Acetonema longum DSM 6540 TaxID=1009370 RepID=F7NII6_9FIRM|nr:iron-containing alcohol dehydrogenase [Acetonema longum]EGO64132.1 alcohol dehydrogenase [Acetonema longum DSM 6540]
MNHFLFRLPTRVMFGQGALGSIAVECVTWGVKKAFLVTGRTSTKGSPHLAALIESLEQAGITVRLFAEVEADPSVETVDRGAALIKEFGADTVFAFGGGSPMDAAKSMSMLQGNPGSISDYIRGRKTISRPGLPLICIPTTAGTGSEVTAAAVTTDTKTREKIGLSHDYMMPKLAVIDPELHVSMPPGVTAATGIDALTHAIEAYVATQAEPITDALCLHAIRLIGSHLRRAVACGKDIEARSQMAAASLIAGAGFTNAGLGAVHGIAHPVGAQFGVPHGVANGIMLPYVMEYCLMADYAKFRDIAVAMGQDVTGLSLRDAAYLAVSAVRDLETDIGIPQTLAEAGVPQDKAEDIVKDAANYRLLPNSPRQLTIADLRTIVQRAMG